MLVVTKEGVKPIDAVAEILIADEFYILLAKDQPFRETLLKEMNATRLIVDRLGEEKVKESLFTKDSIEVDIPSVDSKREVGYYCRL